MMMHNETLVGFLRLTPEVESHPRVQAHLYQAESCIKRGDWNSPEWQGSCATLLYDAKHAPPSERRILRRFVKQAGAIFPQELNEERPKRRRTRRNSS